MKLTLNFQKLEPDTKYTGIYAVHFRVYMSKANFDALMANSDGRNVVAFAAPRQ